MNLTETSVNGCQCSGSCLNSIIAILCLHSTMNIQYIYTQDIHVVDEDHDDALKKIKQ